MLLENKEVVIIGGGPGGLTLARLLQLKGINVKVYERDFNRGVRVQGATLDLHFESGLKVMEKAGLTDAFKKNYRPGADKGRILDKKGNILYDEHLESSSENFGNEHFRPEIDRGALRDMLSDSLQPVTVVWDSHFLNMEPIGEKWKLKFKSGNVAIADLVIGADGANSKIRPFVTSVKPYYAGIIIFQGNVSNSKTVTPNIYQLLKGGKIYIHSDEKYMHISSKGDGSIDFYISCKKSENWIQNSEVDFSDRQQLITWFKDEFSGWSDIWHELVENTNLPLLVRPQYCMPLDQTWDTLPNLTMLGDAAHIMPPSGEGVNLAMLDALELSECLTNRSFNNLQSAIEAYEKPMHIKASKEAKNSMEMVEWMHAEDGQAKMLAMLHQNQ